MNLTGYLVCVHLRQSLYMPVTWRSLLLPNIPADITSQRALLKGHTHIYLARSPSVTHCALAKEKGLVHSLSVVLYAYTLTEEQE